jgi:uncharacterized protein (TIGR02271 family)
MGAREKAERPRPPRCWLGKTTLTDTPFHEGARAQAAVPAPDVQTTPGDEVIALSEETVTVGKRFVERGGVRVRLITDEIAELARLTLRSERLEIERVPVGREVEDAPSTREEDGVMIIPILEEIIVVTKRLVLKEELHIRRVTEAHEVTQPVTVRRQRAEVERIPAAESSPAVSAETETGNEGNKA